MDSRDEEESITDSEYVSTRTKAYLIVQAAMVVTQLDESIQFAKSAQAIGPLVDPTAYIKNADKLRDDIEVMESVRELQRRIQKLQDSIKRV